MAPTKADEATPLVITPPSDSADAHAPSTPASRWWAAVPAVAGCMCLGSAAYLVRSSASSTPVSGLIQRTKAMHAVDAADATKVYSDDHLADLQVRASCDATPHRDMPVAAAVMPPPMLAATHAHTLPTPRTRLPHTTHHIHSFIP